MLGWFWKNINYTNIRKTNRPKIIPPHYFPAMVLIVSLLFFYKDGFRIK